MGPGLRRASDDADQLLRSAGHGPGEVTATGVLVAKGVVIAQLVITAVEMAAAAATTVATLGIAAAAEAAAIESRGRPARQAQEARRGTRR